MKAYLINLPQATERLAYARASLADNNLECCVVEGVLGRLLQLPHQDYQETTYQKLHGKRTNLAELGCYFSHIKALRMFLDTEDSHCLVLEDDISLSDSFSEVLQLAMQFSQQWDILRLTGLHHGTPLRILKLNQTHSLCVNLSRQTGAGGYVVNRKAAEKLVEHLLPMRLPYDHAFDKEWDFGIRAMCIDPMPISQLSDYSSQIEAADSYKLPLVRRHFTVFPYHAYNETRRVFHRLSQFTRQKNPKSNRQIQTNQRLKVAEPAAHRHHRYREGL